jgi:hypothetical protein
VSADLDCIKLSATFRPRAEGHLLTQLTRQAWAAKNKHIEALRDEFHVVDEIITLFSRLYPAADMAVLAKYSKAEPCKFVHVRIHNPQSKGGLYHDITINVEIPEDKRILIPCHTNSLYACGPRFSEDPEHGIKPEYRATLSPEAADNLRLPKATEVFFEAVAAAQHAYRRESIAVEGWPAEYKDEFGTYPTWEKIANQFPVVGDYLRNVVLEAA